MKRKERLFDKQSLALLISVVMINVICIITVSYAYFTTQIKGNESSTPIEVVMGTMKIQYDDSNLVTLNDALPGDYLINKFKITNIGTLDAVYNLKIDVVENNFRDKGDLEYILRRNDEGVVDSGTLPYVDGYILTNITIPSEEIHNYELEVRFKKDETDKDQNDNKNRKLEFKIEVDTKENVEKYVYEPLYKDGSGANAPELYQGMIPIYYNEANQIVIADVTKEWYDYDKHNWANAVLIDHTKPEIVNKFYKEDGTLKDGDIVTTDDILQMYVWIPRYKYQLFNANNGSVDPQMINIEFEKNDYTTGTVKCSIDNKGKETCNNDINGNWYSHPAFTFGDTELNGIWVGKFETAGELTDMKILPNSTPILQKNLFDMFNASRNIENTYAVKYNLDSNEIDTHLIKNMDWGAMAYLTQSKYGRCDNNGLCTEIAKNSIEYTTGYAIEPWNTTNGKTASTTDNMYGIYDTSGCGWEYTMGKMLTIDGTFNSSGFGESFNDRYYDKYEYGTNYLEHNRGHLGDATRETLKTFGSDVGGWYGDTSYFPNGDTTWFARGGRGISYNDAGIFNFHTGPEQTYEWDSFRLVLTSQDGLD